MPLTCPVFTCLAISSLLPASRRNPEKEIERKVAKLEDFLEVRRRGIEARQEEQSPVG